MSLPVTNESKFLSQLASNGPLLEELSRYWQILLDSEREDLHNLAVASLSDPSVRSLAQISKGRCDMLQELIDQNKRYIKK